MSIFAYVNRDGFGEENNPYSLASMGKFLFRQTVHRALSKNVPPSGLITEYCIRSCAL